MATLGTITLAAAVTVTSGTAATASSPNSPSSNASGQSCWLDVSTRQGLCVPAGQDLLATVQNEAKLTIVMPAGSRVGNVTVTSSRYAATRFATSSTLTTTAVSAIYDDINYGGGTLVLTAPSSGCSWSVSNLDTYGWNDRASSFKSFAGCTTALWQDINFGGSHIGYSTNVSAFGSFNDQASSWRTR